MRTELASTKSAPSDVFAHHIVNLENIPSPTFGRVYAILRDHRGFLWFGATNGLYRYDGYEVRVFSIASTRSSGEQFVSAMLQDGDSSLLLGTWNGLWTFNLATEHVAPFLGEIKFGNGRISGLAKDARGRLWVASRTGGVCCYDRTTGKMQWYTNETGLSDDRITCMMIDHSGSVWIGTYEGLNLLDPNTGHVVLYQTHAHNPSSLSSNEIRSVEETVSGEVWIGCVNGLNRLDTHAGRIQRYQFGRGQGEEIPAIAYDPSGRLWVAVSGLGLFTYTDGRFEQFLSSAVHAPTSIDPHINSIYVDPTSNKQETVLWIGNRGESVDKLSMKHNPFMNFVRDRNLSIQGNGAMLSLLEDREEILWVGLWGGGLNALKNTDGKYTLISHYVNRRGDPFSLPNNNVNCIAQDKAGTIWVGTPDGLAALHPGQHRFIIYKHNSNDSTSLASSAINDIYADNSATLWVCTDGGLSQLIPGRDAQFRNFLHRPQDGHLHVRLAGGNKVTDIVQDHSGNLWASMYGGGLNRIERDGGYTRFLFQGDSDRTHEDWISSIHQDRDGMFWLVTAVGLMKFNPSSTSFERFPSDDLYETHVFDIVDDNHGTLWLSTGIGLVSLEPKTQTFRRFTPSLGISFNELLSNFCRTTKGTFLVGGLNGFTEFSPDRMIAAGAPPQIVITGFSVFDKPMQPAGLMRRDIQLAYDQNFFSFSFAALDYTDPKRNSYAYRMVGLDPGWVDAGSRNFASYTNIDPGEYTFEVKGAGSDDIWNEAGTSVRVMITPPYWRTWWFRIIAGMLIAAMVYGAYRYQLQHILTLERLRLRIAHDLHDDLGSNLSAIAMASKSLQIMPEITAKAKKKLSEIYETALSTSEGMKDLVWFIKPETDTLDNLFLRMKETAPSLLGDIDIDFHLPNSVDSKTISVDFKRCIFLAFKETITNIAKHAHATKVEIRLGLRDNIVEMVVRDNGKGFDTDAHHRGTGLHSLHKRAKSIGGTCKIISQPEQGTIVTFSGKVR